MPQAPDNAERRNQCAPSVAVVLLNWNGCHDTLDCLESLRQVDYPRFEVVIVDNASTDGSCARFVAWAAAAGIALEQPAQVGIPPANGSRPPVPYGGPGLRRIFLLSHSENTGFCAGNNLGLAHAMAAAADYALVLNNDTTVDPDFLWPLVEAAQVEPRAGLIGPVICYHGQPETIWYAGGEFDRWLETRRLGDREPVSSQSGGEPFTTQWISGCATFIPRTTYLHYGGYHEDFFIWSEEWDYSLRVSAGGSRLLVVPNSRVYHKVGRSLGDLKPLSYYYGTRNRLLLKRMHLGPGRRLAALVVFLLIRVPRYAQFTFTGRMDLVSSGLAAIRDYLLQRTGKWRAHDRWAARQRQH
jgi:GT2 family glycosyltransferase